MLDAPLLVRPSLARLLHVPRLALRVRARQPAPFGITSADPHALQVALALPYTESFPRPLSLSPALLESYDFTA